MDQTSDASDYSGSDAVVNIILATPAASVLFIFSLGFAVELRFLLYPFTTIPNKLRIARIAQLFGPVWGCGQIVGLLNVPRQPRHTADLDLAIVGFGPRLSIFLPTAGLCVSSILGYFHVSASGAKELGLVLLPNLLWFAIGLCIWGPTLKLPELLVALIAIDSASSGLSIMLADKEALAARKLVYSTCVAQLVALGAAAYAMSHFSRTELPNICKFRIVWWGGYVDSSSDLNFDKVSVVLWYFFAARTFSILRTLADSLAFTGIFHDAKHQPPTPAIADATGRPRQEPRA